MISSFFKTLFYIPLYNGLIFILAYIPNGDAGLAIVILTVLVKLALFPLTKKSLLSQQKMKEVEPKLVAIREKYKDNKPEQAKQTMAVYKESNLNPFSGIFLILIQFPIIIALYQIFLQSGLPNIDTSLLYSFVNHSPSVSMNFLGLLDVSEKSLVLALIAGVTQFFQAQLALPATTPDKTKTEPSFRDDLMKGMQLQMKYVLPVFITFIAWSVSGAVALYLATSNVVTLLQELYMRRAYKK